MAIIDREGLFKGKRLRKCSAAARWRWPYLFLMSNGYARIELDYESIADEFSSFRESAPTPDELRETFAEFRANHLIFVYAVNDQEWGSGTVGARGSKTTRRPPTTEAGVSSNAR